MTDPARVRDLESAVSALPRGAAVVLRHYDAPDRVDLARKLARACRRKGLVFLVAMSWRVAMQTGAHGLHLPEHQAARGPCPAARLWIKRRGALLTAAAHGPKGLARAKRIQAAAVMLSPVLPTASHPHRAALGLARAALMARQIRIPVLALGGMRLRQRPQVRAAGFAGMAGVGFAATSRN